MKEGRAPCYSLLAPPEPVSQQTTWYMNVMACVDTDEDLLFVTTGGSYQVSLHIHHYIISKYHAPTVLSTVRKKYDLISNGLLN